MYVYIIKIIAGCFDVHFSWRRLLAVSEYRLDTTGSSLASTVLGRWRFLRVNEVAGAEAGGPVSDTVDMADQPDWTHGALLLRRRRGEAGRRIDG